MGALCLSPVQCHLGANHSGLGQLGLLCSERLHNLQGLHSCSWAVEWARKACPSDSLPDISDDRYLPLPQSLSGTGWTHQPSLHPETDPAPHDLQMTDVVLVASRWTTTTHTYHVKAFQKLLPKAVKALYKPWAASSFPKFSIQIKPRPVMCRWRILIITLSPVWTMVQSYEQEIHISSSIFTYTMPCQVGLPYYLIQLILIKFQGDVVG